MTGSVALGHSTASQVEGGSDAAAAFHYVPFSQEGIRRLHQVTHLKLAHALHLSEEGKCTWLTLENTNANQKAWCAVCNRFDRPPSTALFATQLKASCQITLLQQKKKSATSTPSRWALCS